MSCFISKVLNLVRRAAPKIGVALALTIQTYGAEPLWPQPVQNWRLELIAEAPVLRHPSVVACAPNGRVFVAEDPMDIIAPADATLGRILCLHPDGRWTVFATNLHAVFGLQYLEGKLYVLHNPKFSVFTDDNGVGRNRSDLIEQTNPNPWALDWNDHIPANFRLGMDGHFYMAVGDKGLYQCVGRDGSRVNLHGGGVVRMRPDATGLEIFSTGVRNILDVAINAEDEIFTYDNTDEHQWMGRLTHMVDGGFYGYPYDFIPQRSYTLWMMHDFGAGAACGAVAYNEDALPAAYRGNVFLSDFGKRQVFRARVARERGTFRVVEHEDMFAETPADFRPVGIAFAADGLSLYICDWQHRDIKVSEANVGRLWKLTWTGKASDAPKPEWWQSLASGAPSGVGAEELIRGLGHPSSSVRMTAQRALARLPRPPVRELASVLRDSSALPESRWHALWALDAIDGGTSAHAEIATAITNAESSVARQAIRQAGARGNKEAVPQLLSVLRHRDASIRVHAATALGRIGDTNAIPSLQAVLTNENLFPRHAAFTALNRIGRAHPDAWPAIVAGLASTNDRVREGIIFAARETFSKELVAALERYFTNKSFPLTVRQSALGALAALHHQPPEWKGEWWAYHPAKGPAPERTLEWAGTTAILRTLRSALAEEDAGMRLVAVEGLSAARDSGAGELLRRRFENDPDLKVRSAALNALARSKDPAGGRLAARTLLAREANDALRLLSARLAPEFAGEDTRAALIEALRNRSEPPELRRAVVESLGKMGGDGVVLRLRDNLRASSLDERRVTIRALGQLRARAAVPELLQAWQDPETRPEAFTALCRIPDARAIPVYLEGLSSADPAQREQARNALEPMRREALAEIERRAETLSGVAKGELRRLYKDDEEVLRKPFLASDGQELEPVHYEDYALKHAGDRRLGERVFNDLQGAACIRCHAVAGQGGGVGPDLTMAGTQFSRTQLIESVLYPSRAVREGYQLMVVDTRDGETVSGALKADTADGLTLMDAAGHSHFVARDIILDRRISDMSLMPEGIQTGMSLEDFANLIAYLESLKDVRPAQDQ